jgi:hypothetical protein
MHVCYRQPMISWSAAMVQDEDLLALSRRLDELVRSTSDPSGTLAELVRRYGEERVFEEARIVFASWRSRIDLIEELLARRGPTALG